jgi:hypothetical protein
MQAAPMRGAATEGDARAAAHVREHLETIFPGAVHTQEFTGQRSIWLFLALAFGFAGLGHSAYWLLLRPLGPIASMGIMVLGFGLGAVALVRKFTFQDFPFQTSLPHGMSRNVIARIAPAGERRRTVVLVAHLDAQRAVWWFATDGLARLYARLVPVAIYGVVLAPLSYAAAVVLELPILAWAGGLLGVVHMLAWFTGVTADLGLYSPGANDNAAAVGTALAIGERLSAHPMHTTEVWLLFTSCEETGCDGMRAFLAAYGDQLQDALFIDLELVGVGGRVVYLRSEGLVRRLQIDPQIERLLARSGRDLAVEAVEGSRLGIFTEMGVVWERGYSGVCLLCMPKGQDTLPHWHRLDDVLGNLDPLALERMHAFVWRLLAQES